MNSRLAPTLMVVLLLALCVAPSQAASQQARLAQFLAGCELLSTAVTVPPERKAEAMRWLVAYTRITPKAAVAMLKGYRDRPEAWLKVLDTMQHALEPQAPKKVEATITKGRNDHGPR